MSVVSERLAYALKVRNMKQVDLVNLTGIGKSSISTYLTGAYTPKQTNTYKIAKALSVNPAWLLGEDVPMEGNDPVPDLPNIVPLRRIRVPILGDIAAGEPVLAEEHLQEYAELDENMPRCDYGLRVTSDSMEPTIRPGDLVFIRQQDDVDDGQIAAVLLDDSATLKHIYHMPGGLQLLSENVTKYPPRVVTFEEYNTIKILGLAVAYRRKL